MPEELPSQNQSPTEEETQHRIPFRKIAATVAAALAFASAVEVPELAVAATHTNRETSHYWSLPKKPNRLQGAGISVKPETKEALQKSTVKIMLRAKGVEGGWFQHCTGTKVTVAGSEYVATAAHCFSFETGEKTGSINGSAHPEYNGAKALDFSQGSIFEYAVGDPVLSADDRSRHPLAIVTGIAISLEKTDWALLKVEPTPTDATNALRPRTFADIPALAYTPGLDQDKQPIPGQKVTLYGIPASSNNVPLPRTGVYIGRSSSPDGQREKIDYVAANPSRPEEDACDFGSSGSSFLASGNTSNNARIKATFKSSVKTQNSTKAKKPSKSNTKQNKIPKGKDYNFVSGPLSIRLNTVYDPERPEYYSTSVNPNTPVSPIQIDFMRSVIQSDIDWVAGELAVDVDSYTTICGYSVARPNKTINTLGNLAGAFGHYAPPRAITANHFRNSFKPNKLMGNLIADVLSQKKSEVVKTIERP